MEQDGNNQNDATRQDEQIPSHGVSRGLLISGILLTICCLLGAGWFLLKNRNMTQSVSHKEVAGGAVFTEVFRIGKDGDFEGDSLVAVRGKKFFTPDGKIYFLARYPSLKKSEIMFGGVAERASDQVVNLPEGVEEAPAYQLGSTTLHIAEGVSFPTNDTVYEVAKVGKMIAYRTKDSIYLDGREVDIGDTKPFRIWNIGGKFAYATIDTKAQIRMVFDGKTLPYALYLHQPTVIEYAGQPVYVSYEATSSGQGKVFLVLGERRISEVAPAPYGLSEPMKIGNKIAYKRSEPIVVVGKRTKSILVVGTDKVGTEFDMITGLVDDGGVPIFVGRTYARDKEGTSDPLKWTDALVRGSKVLFRASPGDLINPESIVLLNGKLAFSVVHAGKSYLIYDQRTYFTDGYRINSIRDVDGKLVVAVNQHGIDSIYVEGVSPWMRSSVVDFSGHDQATIRASGAIEEITPR